MPLQSLEPVDLNAVVREASELMSANASIRFEMDLHEGPLTVEADREALRRVFINFVKNAVEAVPEDREGRIRITTDLEDDMETGLPWVVAEVSDNGCGIAPELREKIFTPSFSTKTSGAGLGLAIARNTVEELRGRIGFDTEEGRGSTFWVRIPLFQAPEAADGPV
jgi:signal transduction histidine kinase